MIAKDVLMTFEQIWWVNYKEKRCILPLCRAKPLRIHCQKNT